MIRRALLALVVVLSGACRSSIQLENPILDAGVILDDGALVNVPPRCPGIPSRSVVTTVDPRAGHGQLRAIAVGGGSLYALFARAGTNEGVLKRVPTSGGELVDLARVGLDPSALALAPDASYAFVAARGSSQVFRVDGAGVGLVTDARGAPSSVVADGRGGAFWTVPATDSVMRWDFASGAPSVLATTPRPTSLLLAASTLYITGDRLLRALVPDVDTAPRTLATQCTGGAPAIAGQVVYCADGSTIAKIDLASGVASITAEEQPGAADVVISAGRVFWRSSPTARQTLVMSFPLDEIGGPTVFEGSEPGPLLLARDACDLYFSAGSAIVRRRL